MWAAHLGYFYLRCCSQRLSVTRLGLGEFQLRLSFVEEACVGGMSIQCPSRPPVMGSIDSVAR